MKKLYVLFSAAAAVIILGISAEMSFLSADQDIIKEKCTKCHAPKIPDNYTKAEWKYNVDRMAQRAGLTPKEIQSLIDLNKKK